MARKVCKNENLQRLPKVSLILKLKKKLAVFKVAFANSSLISVLRLLVNLVNWSKARFKCKSIVSILFLLLYEQMFYSRIIRQIFFYWPVKGNFGVYRFLPIFFVLGAALEFTMIKWHVGEVNFCKLYVLKLRMLYI